MMDETMRLRRALVAACLHYEANAIYDEDHPEDPHGDASMGLATDMLDDAAAAYVKELAAKAEAAMAAATFLNARPF